MSHDSSDEVRVPLAHTHTNLPLGWCQCEVPGALWDSKGASLHTIVFKRQRTA